MAKRGASSRTIKKTLTGPVVEVFMDLAAVLLAVMGRRLPAMIASTIKTFFTRTPSANLSNLHHLLGGFSQLISAVVANWVRATGIYYRVVHE